MLFRIVILYFIFTGTVFAASTDDVRQFVDETGQKVIAVVDDKNKSQGQKKSELRQMFLDNVDIMWISRFVLGRGWREATPDQKSRYMKVYREYMVAIYTGNFSEYTGSKYNIIEVRSEGNGQFIVRMQIKTNKTNQPETIAGYRILADENGRLKIIDIIVEGISLLSTQRSEFGSVLGRNGMEGLINALERKAIEAEKSPR